MPARKTAIISGGCGGIGKFIGKKLSEDGFDVVALYFKTPHAEAEAVLKTFASGNHEALLCDIRDESATAAMFAGVLAKHGSIDACVHAAVGPIIRKSILELTADELRSQCDVGFFGGFNFVKPAATAMKAQKSGTIVGMLSRASVQPDRSYGRMGGYSVAKGCLRALLKEFSKELSLPIRVNAVAPSFIDTPLSGDIPGAVKDFLLERTPGKKEDAQGVADAVSYLCSPKSAPMNGKIFSSTMEELVAL
jgi:NAD(P)-dependent dehydrogenase (short-subunit alcohol dehydrogenase family)